MARTKSFSGYGQELQGTTTEEMSPRSSNNRTPIMAPTQQAIRERAYEIFQARGGRTGTEFEDWIAAEGQLVKAARRRLQDK